MKILTDDVEEKPTIDFEFYANAITSIIKDSEPAFTIGIYGEWGSGKTTMMNLIQGNLKKESVPVVEFNAWRYEREETRATVPLILEILSKLYEKIDLQIKTKEISERSKRKVLEKFSEKARKYLSDWSVSVNVPIPIGSVTFNRNPRNILSRGMQNGLNIPKPTIQEGIEIIKKLIEELDSRHLNNGLKLVVFIDDLDRCSSGKALEVLESVKILLDIKGVVYVMGISIVTLSKIISEQYKLSDIDGEQYMRKIIQVPIPLPPWNKEDIKKLIDDNLLKKLDPDYSNLVSKFRDQIADFIEPNPRELKRFVNTLVIAEGIFSNSPNFSIINKEVFLILEIIKARWNELYLFLFTNNAFFSESKNFFARLPPPIPGTDQILPQITDIRDFLSKYETLTENDRQQSMNKIGIDLQTSASTINMYKRIFGNDDLLKIWINFMAVTYGIPNLDAYRKVSETASYFNQSTSEVLSVPQNLVALGGDAQVSLSWQMPFSKGMSAPIMYNIYRGTTSWAGTLLASIPATSTSYLDKSVTNGVTYYYYVTSANSTIISPPSNEVSVTPQVILASSSRKNMPQEKT